MKALAFALILSLLMNVLLVRLACVLVTMVKEAETNAQAAWSRVNTRHDRP